MMSGFGIETAYVTRQDVSEYFGENGRWRDNRENITFLKEKKEKKRKESIPAVVFDRIFCLAKCCFNCLSCKHRNWH